MYMYTAGKQERKNETKIFLFTACVTRADGNLLIPHISAQNEIINAFRLIREHARGFDAVLRNPSLLEAFKNSGT